MLNTAYSKFVVLQGIEHGNRFFTDYHGNAEDVVRLTDGTIAYKILGFANTVEEAQVFLYGKTFK